MWPNDIVVLFIPATSTGLGLPGPAVMPSASAYRSRSGGILPQFEDANRTTFYGEPGGAITLDCNIFMLQDYVVSGWGMSIGPFPFFFPWPYPFSGPFKVGTCHQKGRAKK